MSLVEVVMLIFPIIAILLGILGYIKLKNNYVAPILVAVLSTILTFTLFNNSFIGWVVLYTLLALLAGVFTKSIIKTYVKR